MNHVVAIREQTVCRYLKLFISGSAGKFLCECPRIIRSCVRQDAMPEQALCYARNRRRCKHRQAFQPVHILRVPLYFALSLRFFFHTDEAPKLIAFHIFDGYVLDAFFQKLLALLANGYDEASEEYGEQRQ